MTEFSIDMSEGEEPTEWESRFEGQINLFFDEAISRVPNFADRNIKSFRRVMSRSVAPKTGIGDVLVGIRNLASGVSESVGGPKFETTTYTHDALTRAFAKEVVSTEELETLLARLFQEFERAMWNDIAANEETDIPDAEFLQERLKRVMEREIAHDPLLAQAIRAGVRIGVPATLGYVMFGRMRLSADESVGDVYSDDMRFYHRMFQRLGRYEMSGWVGALGWAGGVVGTLAIGGLMEYTINSVRDIKGQYIRQLNSARYSMLYGDDPDDPQGRGVLHIVRGLEREFQKVDQLSSRLEARESE
jgi:hypothetical protein